MLLNAIIVTETEVFHVELLDFRSSIVSVAWKVIDQKQVGPNWICEIKYKHVFA